MNAQGAGPSPRARAQIRIDEKYAAAAARPEQAAQLAVRYDSDRLPEGLGIESGSAPGTLAVTDAQGHVWLTLHDSAPGDPETWRETILAAVMMALGIEEVDAEV